MGVSRLGTTCEQPYISCGAISPGHSCGLSQYMLDGCCHRTVSHTVNLLRSAMPFFSGPAAKLTADVLLKIMAGGNQVLFCSCASVFQSLFERYLADGDTTVQIPAGVLGECLEGLFVRIPSAAEAAARVAWQNVICAGYVAVTRIDAAQACALLPRFANELVGAYLSDHTSVTDSVTVCLNMVTESCIGVYVAQLVEQHNDDALGLLKDSIAAYASALRFRYQAHYPEIFTVISNLFRALGRHSHPLLDNVLRSLIQMRSSRDAYKSRIHIERAVGAAVSAMGIATFLSVAEMDLISEVLSLPVCLALVSPALACTGVRG